MSKWISRALFATTVFVLAPTTFAADFFMHDGMLGARWKYQKNVAGKEKTNDVQYHLDAGGGVGVMENKLKLEFHARTGSSYTSGWSNTGLGRSDDSFDFHVRRLYLSYQPSTIWGFMTGSMAQEYGAGTSNTSFDGDGWITGYRINYSRNSSKFHFTYGDLSDYSKPSFFERTEGMGEFNFGHMIWTYDTESKNQGSFGYIYNVTDKADHYAQVAFKKNYNDGDQYVVIEDTLALTKKRGNAVGLTMGSKFGSMMKASLAWAHKTTSFILPTNDKILAGHNAWLALKFPKIWKGGDLYDAELFVNHIHNLSHSKGFRSELGLTLKF